jgi:hypothetical protein
MPEPVSIPITLKMLMDVKYYAGKVVFDSFRSGMHTRFGNGGIPEHEIGKFGELAFFRFCLENGIPVKHVPFREDYSSLDENDDFIIVLKSRQIPIEVKTSEIRDPLRPSVKSVFYNESQYKEKLSHNFLVVFAAINRQQTQLALLGWIPAKKIAKYNVRRDIKSPAYVIPVKDLKPMSDFLKF